MGAESTADHLSGTWRNRSPARLVGRARPEAAYLREDIYELRARHQNLNLRMLYFFHGRTTVVVSHGLVKQRSRVPKQEIALAVRSKKSFEASPNMHTHES